MVQKAVYDVDIKFGLGVLGHQGMGLARWALAQGMDGVCHLEQGPWAPHDLCAIVWCKTPFIIWTSNLVLGSSGTKGWVWRGGTSEDGWSLASGAGTWGTPGLVRQSVVQKAVYDVDIKFG